MWRWLRLRPLPEVERSRQLADRAEALTDRLEATTRELERRIEARQAQRKRGGGARPAGT
jgi:hypothetical protein